MAFIALRIRWPLAPHPAPLFLLLTLDFGRDGRDVGLADREFGMRRLRREFRRPGDVAEDRQPLLGLRFQNSPLSFTRPVLRLGRRIAYRTAAFEFARELIAVDKGSAAAADRFLQPVITRHKADLPW